MVNPKKKFFFQFKEDTFNSSISLEYAAKYRKYSRILANGTTAGAWKPLTDTGTFWLKFKSADRVFEGTPGEADMQKLDITITGDDGFSNVTSDFSIDVTNSPPTVNLNKTLQM